MVSSVSSDSHRISFVVIFALFIRIFTLLSDLILKFFFCFNFHISGVFFLKFVLLFPLSLLEVHNFPVQFCLFFLLYYFLSFSNFIYHYQGFPLLALVQHFFLVSYSLEPPPSVKFLHQLICYLSVLVFLHLLVCLHPYFVNYSNSFSSKMYMFVWH